MSDNLLVGVCVFVVALVIGGMVAGVLMNDYRISQSPDPVAMACALGKKDACLAIAKRP